LAHSIALLLHFSTESGVSSKSYGQYFTPFCQILGKKEVTCVAPQVRAAALLNQTRSKDPSKQKDTLSRYETACLFV
jgi:hypothetical protein